TADNLILSEDGSVRITDACFYEEMARFDLAGAHCALRARPPYASDISALAEVLLSAIVGAKGPGHTDVAAKRTRAALLRARRDSRAYASASSLADALTSLSSAAIIRQVWRPATATGLMAAFGTV